MRLFGAEPTAAPASDPADRGMASGLDAHLLTLAKVVPSRTVAAGELLMPPGQDDGTVHVIVDGQLGLFAPGPDGGSAVASFRRGDCACAGHAAPAGGTIVARETSTVLTVSPAVMARLPMTLQAVLWRAVAATTAATAHVALEAHATLTNSVGELARLLQEREAQSRLCLRGQVIRDIVSRIPALPAYAVDLARRLLTDDAQVNEIVESIKGDPSLAALVLKTVNSSYFGLRSKVGDYYRAFLLLGANAVYRLVLDSGLRTVMPDDAAGREIQSRAYLVSTIASDVALQSRRVEPQLATTLGLLHDIGAAVGLVLQRREPELGPFFALVDSASLGAELLAGWGLPEQVHRAIARQHLPEYLPPSSMPGEGGAAITVLYLARVMADLVLADETCRTSAAFADAHVAALGFRGETCETLLRERMLPAIARHARYLPRHVQERLPGLAP